MGYLVGTDEAGYGPKLGPLVISATVWWVPGDPRGADLYDLLREVVSAKPALRLEAEGWRPETPANLSSSLQPSASSLSSRVVLADSKVLYRPAAGLALLERGLLAALALVGECPTSWRQAWDLLAPDAGATLDSLPWHLDYEAPLPLAAQAEELGRLVPALRAGVAAAHVRLLAVRSRAVFPDRFNQLTEKHGSKGTALSELTLELVAEVLAPLQDGPVAVVCDKHGGRNRYAGLLQQRLTDGLVEIHSEGRDESVYRWGPSDRRTEIRFRARAERYLPAALASMASKYLRELAMRAFNDYWRRHVPELRPTAGYSGDARRFKAQIAAAQNALGIDDRLLWRNR